MRTRLSIETQEECRSAIEQREDRPQGTQNSAPGALNEKDRDKEYDQDSEFQRVRPHNLFFGDSLADHRWDRRFERPGRADSTDKEWVVFTKEIGDRQYRPNQHNVAKVPGELGQVEFWCWNLRSQVLQISEGTDPPTDQGTE